MDDMKSCYYQFKGHKSATHCKGMLIHIPDDLWFRFSPTERDLLQKYCRNAAYVVKCAVFGGRSSPACVGGVHDCLLEATSKRNPGLLTLLDRTGPETYGLKLEKCHYLDLLPFRSPERTNINKFVHQINFPFLIMKVSFLLNGKPVLLTCVVMVCT